MGIAIISDAVGASARWKQATVFRERCHCPLGGLFDSSGLCGLCAPVSGAGVHFSFRQGRSGADLSYGLMVEDGSVRVGI
jgi:hypothetical protein